MAAISNAFGELEHLGSLEPFASRREMLNQLRLSSEREREVQEEEAREAAARAQKLSTGVGKFSDAEKDSIKTDGWTVVSRRMRARTLASSVEPSEGSSNLSAHETTDDDAGEVEVVAPRALPPAAPVPEAEEVAEAGGKRPWKYVRWGTVAMLGAFAVAKLAVRR